MSTPIKPVRAPSPAQRAAWRKRHIARARRNLEFARRELAKAEHVMRLMASQVKIAAAFLRCLEAE